jgi:hypothetical protein
MSFIEFAATKMRSISRKKPFTAITRTGLEAPLDRHWRCQKGRDGHEQRYSYSVRAGQVVGRPKRHYGAQRYDRQCSVHEGT